MHRCTGTSPYGESDDEELVMKTKNPQLLFALLLIGCSAAVTPYGEPSPWEKSLEESEYAVAVVGLSLTDSSSQPEDRAAELVGQAMVTIASSEGTDVFVVRPSGAHCAGGSCFLSFADEIVRGLSVDELPDVVAAVCVGGAEEECDPRTVGQRQSGGEWRRLRNQRLAEDGSVFLSASGHGLADGSPTSSLQLQLVL